MDWNSSMLVYVLAGEIRKAMAPHRRHAGGEHRDKSRVRKVDLSRGSITPEEDLHPAGPQVLSCGL